MTRTLILVCITALFSSACTNNSKIQKMTTTNDIIIEKDFSESNLDIHSNILHCNKELRIWLGSLQSLNPDQIKESYIFGQCQSGNESFDILWVLDTTYEQRAKFGRDEIYELFKNLNFNGKYVKKGFKTIVFKLPLNEVEDILLDDPYTFPCNVKVYHSTECVDGFVFKGVFNIKTWEEYVQLFYQNIFENN